MLVLNSEEGKKAPAWLFPDGCILGPLSSFAGCVMTSSGPATWHPEPRHPRDRRARAPQALLAQPRALWLQVHFIKCRFPPSAPERITKFLMTHRDSDGCYRSDLEKHDQTGRFTLHSEPGSRGENSRSLGDIHPLSAPECPAHPELESAGKAQDTTILTQLCVMHAVFHTPSALVRI